MAAKKGELAPADFQMAIPPGWITTDSSQGKFRFVPSRTKNPDFVAIAAYRINSADGYNSIESMTAENRAACTPNAFMISVRGEEKPITLCNFTFESDIPGIGKTRMHMTQMYVEDPASASIWMVQASVKETAYQTHAALLNATLKSFLVPNLTMPSLKKS